MLLDIPIRITNKTSSIRGCCSKRGAA